LSKIKIVTRSGVIITLTEKQKAVYDLKLNKYTPKEISEKLGICRGTINDHVASIRKKCGYDPFTEENSCGKTKVISNEASPEEQSEIEFLRKQAKYLKSQINKITTANAIEDKIVDLFGESIKSHKPTKTIKEKPSNKTSDEELVLCIGDVHAGEIILSEETMGLNSYNMDVMKERMNKLYNGTNSIVNKMSNHTYNKLHIFCLGDMVSGLIHDELMSGVAVVDQVIQTAHIISEMIEKWSYKFPEIEISAVVGNHGRLQKQIRHKKKYDNFDYLMYYMIKSMCRELVNVSFNIPKSPFLIKKIYDFNFLLMHGDSKVQSYAGIPFYKIRKTDSNLTQTLTASKNIFPHYVVMGHYHTNNTLDKAGMGKIIINGSMVGTSDFALNTMFVSGEPKQTLFGVHKEYGVTSTFDVFVR
jgi:hypothetical protein